MAIEITTTRNSSQYKKFCIYGKSGIGKTELAKQFKKPLIITSENKNETLSDEDYETWKVSKIKDAKKAVKNAIKNGKKYDIVFLDSLTDIHKKAIKKEKPNHNHDMKAYGVVQEEIENILELIRDSNSVHFVIICRVKMFENEEGEDSYYPNLPGKQLYSEISSYFDFVFAMRMHKGKDKETSYRFFQTKPEYDEKWIAKAPRTLDEIEKPDLVNIIKKLQTTKKGKKKNG